MIVTVHGMHVRRVETFDESTGVAIVFGYGSPEQRAVAHRLPISDLRADGGLAEIRAALAQQGHTTADDIPREA
jgi:hypothetical protein